MNHPQPPAESRASFAYRVLLAAGLTILLLLLLLTLWYAVQALLLTFAGVLLAILLRGPADWLALRSRLSEKWALGIVLLSLLVGVLIVGALVAPRVAEQVEELWQEFPEAVVELRQWLEQYGWGRWFIDILPTMDDLQANGFGVIGGALGVAYTAAQIFFGIFIVFFVTLYLAVQPQLYTSGLLHLVPFAQRPRAAEVMAVIGHTLRWWLIASLVRMTAVGVLTFLGLWLLGIPLSFLLALLAFLLDFVPYFGPIAAALPAVLLAFSEGPQQALYVLILYIVIQQIESLVISPMVYQRTIYLPPVITLLAQILLFAMAGALGVILATPLIAVILVLVKMLYVEQTLGDNQIDRPEDAIGPDEKPAVA